jgi:hypothetical protein
MIATTRLCAAMAAFILSAAPAVAQVSSPNGLSVPGTEGHMPKHSSRYRAWLRRKGERVERRGERMERHGRWLARHGHPVRGRAWARDGHRWEHRGERIERRGERLERRGERLRHGWRHSRRDRRLDGRI